MVRQDDEPYGPEDHEEWEEEPPRSVFASMWFRVVVVAVVIGAVAAVSVPYVMNSLNQSPPGPTITRAPAGDKTRPSAPAEVATPAPPLPPTSAPAAPAPAPSASAPASPAPSASVASTVDKAPATTPAKPQAVKQLAQAPKAESAKPAPQKADLPKAAEKPEAAKSEAAKPEPAKPGTPSTKGASGDLWVQVGAYRDTAIVRRVSSALTDKGFAVVESTLTRGARAPEGPAPSGIDRYDVVVSGGVPADVTRKLTAKGLSAEPVSEGAVVRPSLALRDAVTLSNDLRSEGLSVSVRRVGKGAPAAAASPSGVETLHRVRVGPFPDRSAADEAVRKLRELGYTPFIARAGE